MSSMECHIRHIVQLAAEQRSHPLIDDAFALVEESFHRFSYALSPSVLVLFAEVASDLREREGAVARALDLYDALNCEEDQFKVRALLVRCTTEARLGSEACQLKGPHLLQQLRYALKFLTQALGIATRPGNDARYGFLVHNASLVFWDVVRPMCRMGWQRHIVEETAAVLEALKAVAKSAGSSVGGGKDAKGGGGGAAAIPSPVDPVWVVELTLNLAFGLEDAGKPDAEVVKRGDEAGQLLDEALKQNPHLESSDPRLKPLVLNARAHFARKTPGKTKDDIDKACGSTVAGTAMFVRNGGISKEASEEELIKAWTGTDKEFDLRVARDTFDPHAAPSKQHEKVNLKAAQVVDLCTALRAACVAERWQLALAMRARLLKCTIPAGRGRVLSDLAKADLDVRQACTLKYEDPDTKMLLTPEAQRRLELEARIKSVRLCEQCAMTAQRIGEFDLVEESAVAMWNIGRELMFSEQRIKIRQSLSRCAEILGEVKPARLVQLRVQLHFEVACCEIAQDLLTKGQQELRHAKALDYTVPENEVDEASKKYLAEKQDVDPAPYVRRFDPVIEEKAHLLHWKQSIYEDPTDTVDQVMLLLDQAQQKGARSSLNLLVQGFGKLESALEGLRGEKFLAMKAAFEPPPRHVTSARAMQALPHHAPASVKVGGEGDPVRDQRPRSEQEDATMKAKRIVMLICRISLEAFRAESFEFAVKACDCALEAAAEDAAFGPPPVEVEGALLLADAAYTKAQCLSKGLEQLGVINGIDDEIDEEKEEVTDVAPPAGVGTDAEDFEDEDEDEELTPEQKADASAKKRSLIQALFYGIEKSHEFKQWWMVANGLAYWWNLHLELVTLSSENPKLLDRTLPEYREGLKQMQKYLHGEAALPQEDFQSLLAANLLLANVHAGVSAGQFSVLETDQLLVVKRLSPAERKTVMADVTHFCKVKGKPLPDLVKLRPERLDAVPPAGGKEEKGKKGKESAAPPVPEDKTDLLGQEADVMQAVMSVPHAANGDEAKKFVDQAVQILSNWEPRHNDENALALAIELWTRLGRKCMEKPMHPNVGAKYALMCCIKGLGQTDAPAPKHASTRRLSWRGAAHALCGDVFVRLVDPQKQEKESVLKLRKLSVEQYRRCCEYAVATRSSQLAINGAASMWNVALPLLLSAETRQFLIQPLLSSARALATVKWNDDPNFLVMIYTSIFDGYSDTGRWDKAHEMLNEAFQAVPASGQRRLWAMRMLALSRQGKNIAVAMGKMKETQAKPQAKIWLTLADASTKRSDQLDAYTRAIDILQDAQQPDVVEVRMQFADWLLRNGFGPRDALDQLGAAADLLLDIEGELDEDDEAEEDDESDGMSYGSKETFSRARTSSKKSKASSGAGSRRGSKISKVDSRTASRRGSKGSKTSGVGSKRRAGSKSSKSQFSMRSSKSSRSRRKSEEDVELSDQLFSHNYEALCRVYTMRSRLTHGGDTHAALLGAVHFAVRFFASTVELANTLARELAATLPDPVATTDEPDKLPTGAKRELKKKSTQRKVDPDRVVNLLPSFVMPLRLVDWASPQSFAWRSDGLVLQQLIARADQEGVLPGGMCTWAGHPDVFAQPPLTFHLSSRLLGDLEEHGYHLWALPVLALQLELAACFDEPIGNLITCLAHMRLSRVAAECRLPSTVATDNWQAAIQQIPATFGTFEDELDQVRSQRAGKGGAGELDPAWLEEVDGQRDESNRLSAPWLCTDLHAYQVWAEVAQECLVRGELWMASKLTLEAIRHARIYGDSRALRALLITKAQLAQAEGNSSEVVKILKEVSTSDPRQAAQVAILLAAAYREQQLPVVADGVLSEALSALSASVTEHAAGAASGHGRGASAAHAAARAALQCQTVLAELHRLGGQWPAQRWKTDLGAAFSLHMSISEDLGQSALHFQRLVACINFIEAALVLLETKRASLARESVAADGLDFRVLASFVEKACDAVEVCRPSQRLLLSKTVPMEGTTASVALPSERLTAALDVCDARARAFRRELTTAQMGEEARLAALAKRKAPLEGLFSMGPGFSTGGAPTTARTQSQKLQEAAGQVEAWLDKVGEQLTEEEKVRSEAREMAEVEASMGLVANAVSVQQPPPAAESSRPPSAGQVDAIVELGLLQMELALLQAPKGTTVAQRWQLPDPDPYELCAMEMGERCSNAVHGRDPNVLYKVPAEGEEEPPADDTKKAAGGKKGKEDAAAKAKAKAKAAPAAPDPTEEKPAVEEKVPPPAEPPSKEVDFDRVGRSTLCSALRAALAARRFAAARRACRALALQGWGTTNQEATFEFLVWLQSVDVCARAEDAFGLLLPEDHQEHAQMSLLRLLESSWEDPSGVDAYRSVRNRLMVESPLFQRLQLLELPPICEVLLSYIPPLTLVVTLQLHGDHIYIGAACSPPEGDRAQRQQLPLRHFVRRFEASEAELYTCVQKFQDLNAIIEKDLMVAPEFSDLVSEQYRIITTEVERALLAPLARELAAAFWPLGSGLEHPNNPKQLVLLPDSLLWHLPLESSHSLIGLFGPRHYGSLSRDFSLHAAALRTRHFVEGSDGERKQVLTKIAGFKPSSTILLTDAFDEDVLHSSEDLKSDTMCKLHTRLVDNKAIGNGARSVHGQQFSPSPADISAMLADSTAFLSLGFCRFFVTMSSRDFASQNLKHLSLLALFCRAVNSSAFRRQTKSDSLKSPNQREVENSYGTPLIAAFRGVQCSVLASGPVPIAVSMRVFEVFVQVLASGASVGKAMEEAMRTQVDTVANRYARPVSDSAKPKEPKQEEADGEKVDLVPQHTRGAYMVVGAPWVSGEEGPSDGGKPGKKK